MNVNNLIIITYPFVIFTSLLTIIVVGYSTVKTARLQLQLWWFMVGVIIVASCLALENSIFMYARVTGKDLYNAISNSTIVYCIKIIYGFGMWIHFCSAVAAINGSNISRRLITLGLLSWGAIYSMLLFIYFNFI